MMKPIKSMLIELGRWRDFRPKNEAERRRLAIVTYGLIALGVTALVITELVR